MTPRSKPAEHGARDVADAPQDGGRERLQPQDESHVVVADSVVEHDHHSGHCRQVPNPATKVNAMMRLMLMPISPATSAFCSVARIAVPNRVRVDKPIKRSHHRTGESEY